MAGMTVSKMSVFHFNHHKMAKITLCYYIISHFKDERVKFIEGTSLAQHPKHGVL